MKKTMGLLTIVILSVYLAGCACVLPTGAFYTEVQSPIAAGDGKASYSKVGVSKATSYFGLVATGDASIRAAVENGGIKKISWVDYSSKNILGIMGEYTTTVYGDYLSIGL